VLNKVYRNTKNILRYIETLGYKVTIPDSLREGAEVIEKVDFTTEQQFEYVQSVIQNNPNVTVGILAKEIGDLEQYNKAFGAHENVHVSTMINAQGVEFDTVCIVGVHAHMCNVEHIPPHHVAEKKKIEKDIMYIALTRAMNYMHILGSSSLKEVVRPLL
jgi:superfamily I DNA/RNA helicase